MQTASSNRELFRDASGHGVIVFDPARLRQASPELFAARAYGAHAQPVQGQGGRGAAWFVSGAMGEGVLRHYRRGGWMARVSSDSYLWLGEQQVRSFREFALLHRLAAAGLPVPAPITAMYRRSGLVYRAAILVERVSGAHSFAQSVSQLRGQAPWTIVGAAIASCHRLHAHHADLNSHNVLISAAQKAWLIDWDKGHIEAGIGHWCERVLDRLQRSLRKECPDVPESEIIVGMKQLREAHEAGLQA